MAFFPFPQLSATVPQLPYGPHTHTHTHTHTHKQPLSIWSLVLLCLVKKKQDAAQSKAETPEQQADCYFDQESVFSQWQHGPAPGATAERRIWDYNTDSIREFVCVYVYPPPVSMTQGNLAVITQTPTHAHDQSGAVWIEANTEKSVFSLPISLYTQTQL